MDLRLLQSFIYVAEELSFRRAAEKLHISQPPLSRQIKALEEELGVRLLERDRCRRVALTDAGHSFLTDARQTLAACATARERAQDAARGSRGKLNIANIAALSSIVLPPLLHAFRKRFPQVEISLVEMTREEQLEGLRESRIHLGIFPDLGAPLESRFESQPFFSCPMVAVLPAGHDVPSEKGGGEISIQTLAGKTLLTPSPKASPGYRERFNQLCAIADFAPASVKAVEGLQNILGMVGAGYGVSIFPEVVVSSVGPACCTRRLRPPVPTFHLKLLWLRGSSSLVLKNFLLLAKREVVKLK
jgi:DNA-binding transcriptional LysR family regulator